MEFGSHRTPIVGVYVVGAVKLSAWPDKKLDSVLLPEPLGPTIVSLSPGASLMVVAAQALFGINLCHADANTA